MWNAITGKRLLTYRGHSGKVNAVAWSPIGFFIASASDDGTVQIWSANNGGHGYTYRGHKGPVQAVAWSPDHRHIASGGDDTTVRVQALNAFLSDGVATREDQEIIYRGHIGRVNAVAFSTLRVADDSSFPIASASDDGTVQVWGSGTGTYITTSSSHETPAQAVAWSLDSSRLASVGNDGMLEVNRIWSLEHIVEDSSYTLLDHKDLGTAVSWSYISYQDSNSTYPPVFHVATSSWDHTVHVWYIPPERGM